VIAGADICFSVVIIKEAQPPDRKAKRPADRLGQPHGKQCVDGRADPES
jgi:hypothetical protein